MRGWAGRLAGGERDRDSRERIESREITMLESSCCDRCVRVHKLLL